MENKVVKVKAIPSEVKVEIPKIDYFKIFKSYLNHSNGQGENNN